MKPMLRNVSLMLMTTLAAPLALADAATDLQALQQEMAAMRADYAQRMAEMEARLQAAEARLAATTETSAPAAPADTHAPVARDNSMNPAIGVILNGRYADMQHDPEDYAIPGFALAEEAGPGERGLSLGESELVLSANVDNQFHAALIAALTPEHEVEVEEAYVQTLALPQGFAVKAGRFLSGIGYQNSQHTHSWDFTDSPLVYRALLGGRYGDDGVQLSWLAPTDLYVELGGEVFRGAGFPAGGNDGNGAGARSVFARVGGDVGSDHSWRLGVAQLRTEADGRETGDADMFSGDSRISSIDAVWKWAPDGNPAQRNLKLQAEHFWRDESGLFNDEDYAADQRGWYAQVVYQFMPRWRVGVRHDRLRADDPGAAFADTVLDTLGHDPRRTSLMVDFANSEFSRLRLQYNDDESQPTRDRQFYLQYIMSIGAHGAHAF